MATVHMRTGREENAATSTGDADGALHALSLYLLVSKHVVIAKPLHTSGRHALNNQPDCSSGKEADGQTNKEKNIMVGKSAITR
jgi:hypothetical protein